MSALAIFGVVSSTTAAALVKPMDAEHIAAMERDLNAKLLDMDGERITSGEGHPDLSATTATIDGHAPTP